MQHFWEQRTDFVDEEDIWSFAKMTDLQEVDYRRKLLEYYTEDPVNATRVKCLCQNRQCRRFQRMVDPQETENGCCTFCRQPTEEIEEPVRSTFFYLVDEGILSVYESGEADRRRVYVRFTYDRMFELMVARHLLSLLADIEPPGERSSQLGAWLESTQDLPVYDGVFVNLLVLLFDQQVQPDPEDRSGRLFLLKGTEAGHPDFQPLVLGLLDTCEARVANLVVRALAQLGLHEDKDKKEAIRSLVRQLCVRDRVTDKGASARRLTRVRVALETARQLSYLEPFLILGKDADPTCRMLAACQAYFLWKQDGEKGLELLEQALSRLFLPLGIPRPALMEFAIGTAVIILLGHPQDSVAVRRILALGVRMARRMGWLARIAAVVLPRLVGKILKDVPSDYNSVNLTELRLAQQELRRDQAFRQAALEYARYLRPGERLRVERQRVLVRKFQENWPKNAIAMVLHQLVQGKALQEDFDGTIAAEIGYSEDALTRGAGLWAVSCLYDLYWLNLGRAKMNEENYRRTIDLWKRQVAEGRFSFEALRPDNRYYSWEISGTALLITDREGAIRPRELVEIADQFLDDPATYAEGIAAFFRGLDIAGPELGTANPDAVKMVLSMFDYILAGRPDLPEEMFDKIAATLHRMASVFPDQVELFMGGLKDSAVRNRIAERQRNMEFSENIGTWVSMRGQEFFLYAMGEPYWQQFFSELFEILIESRSLTDMFRFIIHRILVDELMKREEEKLS